jgi:hypothetical protein
MTPMNNPIDFCEQAKHIRVPHKNVLVIIGSQQAKKICGSGKMDQ